MAWLGYQRVVKSEQFGIWLVRCVYRRMWAPHTLRNRRSPPGPVPIRRADYYSSLAYYRLQRGGKRGKARECHLIPSCLVHAAEAACDTLIPRLRSHRFIHHYEFRAPKDSPQILLISTYFYLYLPLKSHHNPDKISDQQARLPASLLRTVYPCMSTRGNIILYMTLLTWHGGDGLVYLLILTVSPLL